MTSNVGRGRGGVKPAVRKRAAERRKMVLELRLAGANWADICARTGYAHPASAYNAYKEALADIPRQEAAEMRALEAERLDALNLPIWRRAMAGDYQAISQVLDIMRTRARLFGLNIEAEGMPTIVVQKAYLNVDVEKL